MPNIDMVVQFMIETAMITRMGMTKLIVTVQIMTAHL